MKTFSKFLHEAYFSEAQVTQSGEPSTGQAPVTYGRTAPGGRFRSPEEQEAYVRTNEREAKKELERLRRLRQGQTGSAARRDLQFKSPSSSVPEIAARTTQPSAPTDLTPPKGTRTGLRTRLGGFAGPALNVAGAALDYKERRDSGQSRARAAGGATSSLAGWAGGARLGASLPLPPMLRPVAALGFGYLGADGAQQVYDWAANTSRPTRQAISKATGYDEFQRRNALFKPGTGLSGIERASQTSASRQARQVAAQSGTYGASKGTAIAGTGGPTTINRQKGTITSGGRTTKLSSTQLVRDPKTGKQVVGDLAYRGGKPVYLARPSVPSRETTLSAQIGRALNIGRFSKEAESQAAKREYRTALRNTQQYQKNLGLTPQKAKALGLPGR